MFHSIIASDLDVSDGEYEWEIHNNIQEKDHL